MRKFTTAIAAAALCTAMAACTQDAPADTEAMAEAGAFSGTWKIDASTASFENDTTRISVADGTYTCDSCLPPYSVAANGEWQTVDRPGVDGVKVEVIDDNTITVSSRLGDQDLGSSTWTLGENGQTATQQWVNMSGAETVEGSASYTRTAAAAEGAHPLSGGWNIADIGTIDDAALTFTVNVDGDSYASDANGESFTATIGGEPVAISGDDSGRMVAVTMLGDNSYRETYTRDGETLNTVDLTVDGDTMTAVSTDPRDDSVVRYSATRQ